VIGCDRIYLDADVLTKQVTDLITENLDYLWIRGTRTTVANGAMVIEPDGAVRFREELAASNKVAEILKEVTNNMNNSVKKKAEMAANRYKIGYRRYS